MAAPLLKQQARIRVIEMRAAGETFSSIAAETGLSVSTVKRVMRKWKETHSIANLPRGHRKRKLNDRDRRSLARLFKSKNVTTLTQAAEMAAELGLPAVSKSTVWRELRRAGLRAYVQKKKPWLTRAQMTVRLKWAKARKSITAESWRRFIFSDEAKILRISHGSRKWTWVLPSTPLSGQGTLGTLHFGGGSIMIWAAISYHGLHCIVPIEGNLTGQAYADILRDNLRPLCVRHFPVGNGVFQQDNAPCHRARVAMNYLNLLRETGICRHMNWPPHSPDLNPIEHFWVSFKRQVRSYGEPATIQQLRQNITLATAAMRLPVWTERIRTLIESMPRRVLAVIKARGGPTKY